MKSILIGIDGNEANVERKVGISEYSFELITQFKKFPISNVQFQIYLKNEPRVDMPQESDKWRYKVVKPAKLWTQIGLPLYLHFGKFRPDVFFSPTHYAPRFSPIPTAISIMDVSYMRFPELFRKSDLYQLQNWTAYSAKQAAKIFTISKASKNDIIQEYQVSADKVIVTYPGIKLKTQMSKVKTTTQNSKLSEKYGIRGKYILFVGTLQPRKNISRLVEAFSALVQDKSYSNLQLIIVGKKGWLYEEILQAPQKYNVSEKVQFLDFVSDNELTDLYVSAQFFILPSLYEGFGLPILEAMKNGCPVITSNVSSMPEAGGEAALYVDPTNTADITSSMKKLLSQKGLRESLIQKGYEQIKKFSWEKTAQETLKVLQQMGGNA